MDEKIKMSALTAPDIFISLPVKELRYFQPKMTGQNGPSFAQSFSFFALHRVIDSRASKDRSTLSEGGSVLSG